MTNFDWFNTENYFPNQVFSVWIFSSNPVTQSHDYASTLRARGRALQILFMPLSSAAQLMLLNCFCKNITHFSYYLWKYINEATENNAGQETEVDESVLAAASPQGPK